MANPNRQTADRLNYKANFGDWRTKLESSLEENQVKYVLTAPKPPEPTAKTPQNDVAIHQKWLLDDKTARNVILGAFHEKVCVSYHHHTTAASLLEALTEHFTKVTKPSAMSRRLVKFRRYMEHKLAEGKSVNEHVLEMGSMATELESEGVEVSEELQVLMLMNSLPDSWNETVGRLMENMDTEETGLDKVTERLINLGFTKQRSGRQKKETTVSY